MIKYRYPITKSILTLCNHVDTKNYTLAIYTFQSVQFVQKCDETISLLHLWLQILAMGKWNHVALENQTYVMCHDFEFMLCSSAPSNREVLSLDSKPGIFTLMGFIWYSDESQQFLQDIKRCKVCKSIQFWAECHHRCCASPWVMVMLVGGWLPQSRVGWLKSWRTVHFNPEHMKRYAWSATVRADLENYSQKGQKGLLLVYMGPLNGSMSKKQADLRVQSSASDKNLSSHYCSNIFRFPVLIN